MIETAKEDLVFKLDGNKLPLRVVGFFIPRHWRLQRVGWPPLSTVIRVYFFFINTTIQAEWRGKM